MKKLLLTFFALALALSLAACKKDEPNKTVEAEYKFGMGVVVSTASSATNNAQVDATFAAVVTDKDGKIVSVRLDCVQNKMNVTDGAVVTDAKYLTKMEKGDDYNMKKFADDCNIEWYDQAKNFEKYCVGKTAAEVKATEMRTRGESEPHAGYVVVADEALFAQCSIQVGDFIDAIVKACNDEQGKTFKTTDKNFTVGVAATSTGAESTAATVEAEGTVKMYSDFGAVVLQGGKILAALTDAIQPQIKITSSGDIGAVTFKGTKRELKEDYNMKKFADDCNIEWYEQAKNFTDYLAGKTPAEVEAIATKVRNDGVGHDGYIVAADEALFAQCSIQITGFKAVFANAAKYAR